MCVCVCVFVCVCAHLQDVFQSFNSIEGNLDLTSKSVLSHLPVLYGLTCLCMFFSVCVSMCVLVVQVIGDAQKTGYQISCLWFCHQLLVFE